MRPSVILLLLASALACTRKPEATVQPGASLDEALARLETEALPAFDAGALPLEGTLRSVGSDSMDPLFQFWAADFRKAFPKVKIDVVSRGSATAPKALTAGESLLGHMSREMTETELQAFRDRYGYAPLRVVVALDALGVYVNANNPVKSLTMAQVDAIFSSTRKAGFTEAMETWGDLGLSGRDWADRPIQAYGRDEQSGTRAFFRDHVLLKGDYRPTVKTLPDQFAVVEAPAMDAGGISYGPLQHSVTLVKAVPLVDHHGHDPVAPTLDNILKRRYPLTRFLYLYVNKAPGRPLDPTVDAFLRFVLSAKGQARVAQFGALALPADLARQNLRKLADPA